MASQPLSPLTLRKASGRRGRSLLLHGGSLEKPGASKATSLLCSRLSLQRRGVNESKGKSHDRFWVLSSAQRFFEGHVRNTGPKWIITVLSIPFPQRWLTAPLSLHEEDELQRVAFFCKALLLSQDFLWNHSCVREMPSTTQHPSALFCWESFLGGWGGVSWYCLALGVCKYSFAHCRRVPALPELHLSSE